MEPVLESLTRHVLTIVLGGLLGVFAGGGLFFIVRRLRLFERHVRAWQLATWLALPWLVMTTGALGTGLAVFVSVRVEVAHQIDTRILPPARAQMEVVRAVVDREVIPILRRAETSLETARREFVGEVTTELQRAGVGFLATTSTAEWLFDAALEYALKRSSSRAGVELSAAETRELLRQLDGSMINEKLLLWLRDVVLSQVSGQLVLAGAGLFLLWLGAVALVGGEIALYRKLRSRARAPAVMPAVE